MPRITVADTSCLILFHKIDELKLLKKLYSQILISEVVAEEYNNPLPDWISVTELESTKAKGLSVFLDMGEASSIALALEHEHSLLIIDEVKGRKAAKEMGVHMTGSLGVLIAAKRKAYIHSIKPHIKKIQDTNFRISEKLIQVVLEKPMKPDGLFLAMQQI